MSATRPLDLNSLRDLPLPRLDERSDKDSRGRVLAVGGGRSVPGAMRLTGTGALRVGAGKLTLGVAEELAVGLGLAMPEAAILRLATTAAGELAGAASEDLLASAERSDAVVIGPGMLDEEEAPRLARAVAAIHAGTGTVIDAAALTGLDLSHPDLRRAAGRLVLTPHAGEMAKLTGLSKDEVEAAALEVAQTVAAQVQGVVVMKGQTTYVVMPDGQNWRHDHGCVGLGTSGSGDVLAGFIAGFLARGCSPVTAAIWGVYLHAAAGSRLSETVGPVGFVARELLDVAPRLLSAAESGR